MAKEESKMEPEKIRFQFNLPDDYDPVYINGVYGGITPQIRVVVRSIFG